MHKGSSQVDSSVIAEMHEHVGWSAVGLGNGSVGAIRGLARQHQRHRHRSARKRRYRERKSPCAMWISLPPAHW